MMFLIPLVLAATPPIAGLDKPKKVQVGKLGKSELAAGDVTVRCMDIGRLMLVEVKDPGLKGARDAWLKKKNGDAMPPCDGSETDVIRVEGVGGYGYVDGTRGDFIFASSADAFGDRVGLRVFSATTGAMLLDVERSSQKPAALVLEGASLWLRYNEAIPATCDPVGAEAESCWKQLRADTKIPVELEIKPPPCGPAFKGKQLLPGSALLSVPVEVDLNAPLKTRVKRFRAGEATCDVAP
jgi:hypothetical protein